MTWVGRFTETKNPFGIPVCPGWVCRNDMKMLLGLFAVATLASAHAGTIGTGTSIWVRTSERIDVKKSDGRVFMGVEDQVVRDANNSVAIPRGSQVELTLKKLSNNDLVLDLESVTVTGQRYAVTADREEIRATSTQAGTAPSGGFVIRSLRMLEPSAPAPLTKRERFRQYVMGTVGVIPLVSGFAGARINQWRNSPMEWGPGGSGYGKRLAHDLGYNAVRTSISYGTSMMFHEDNRYFASGKQGVWPRTVHAITSAVMARHDDGSRSLSVSSISGIVGASLISQAWSPASWRGADNVSISAAITFATMAGFNFAREFVPDLIRRFQKK